MKLSASLAALLLVDGAAAYAVAPLRAGAPRGVRRRRRRCSVLSTSTRSRRRTLHAASMLVADKASQAADAQLAIDGGARDDGGGAEGGAGDLGWWGTYIKTVEDGISPFTMRWRAARRTRTDSPSSASCSE